MSRNLKMPWSMDDTVQNMECIRTMMIKWVRNANLDGKAEDDVREINFDFSRVRNALKKQIPRKTIEEKSDEDIKVWNVIFKTGTKIHRCPSCGAYVTGSQKFCSNCGQALIW